MSYQRKIEGNDNWKLITTTYKENLKMKPAATIIEEGGR